MEYTDYTRYKINIANKIKTAIIISLKAINIEKEYTKAQYIKQNKSSVCKYIVNFKSSVWYSDLYVLWQVLNIGIKQKRKIVSILKDYSKNYHRCKKNNRSSGYKYLQRFKYKYHKYYNRSFRLEYIKQLKAINSYSYYWIGVAILYFIYKILKINSKFSACRKFKITV